MRINRNDLEVVNGFEQEVSSRRYHEIRYHTRRKWQDVSLAVYLRTRLCSRYVLLAIKLIKKWICRHPIELDWTWRRDPCKKLILSQKGDRAKKEIEVVKRLSPSSPRRAMLHEPSRQKLAIINRHWCVCHCYMLLCPLSTKVARCQIIFMHFDHFLYLLLVTNLSGSSPSFHPALVSNHNSIINQFTTANHCGRKQCKCTAAPSLLPSVALAIMLRTHPSVAIPVLPWEV